MLKTCVNLAKVDFRSQSIHVDPLCPECHECSKDKRKFSEKKIDSKTCQVIEEEINTQIQSAEKRRLPLVESRLTEHCNAISKNIMRLLEHRLDSDEKNLEKSLDDSILSNAEDDTVVYQKKARDNLKLVFDEQVDLKQSFISRDELRHIFHHERLTEIDQMNGTSQKGFIEGKPVGDYSSSVVGNLSSPISTLPSDKLNDLSIFFVILSNLIQNEFDELKRANNEHLKPISQKYEAYYDEIATFLANLNLSHLFNEFRASKIIPFILKDLTKEILDEAKIGSPGEKRIILKAAKEYTGTSKCSSVEKLMSEKEETNKEISQMKVDIASLKDEIKSANEEKDELLQDMFTMQSSVNTVNEIMCKYVNRKQKLPQKH